MDPKLPGSGMIFSGSGWRILLKVLVPTGYGSTTLHFDYCLKLLAVYKVCSVYLLDITTAPSATPRRCGITSPYTATSRKPTRWQPSSMWKSFTAKSKNNWSTSDHQRCRFFSRSNREEVQTMRIHQTVLQSRASLDHPRQNRKAIPLSRIMRRTIWHRTAHSHQNSNVIHPSWISRAALYLLTAFLAHTHPNSRVVPFSLIGRTALWHRTAFLAHPL